MIDIGRKAAGTRDPHRGHAQSLCWSEVFWAIFNKDDLRGGNRERFEDTLVGAQPRFGMVGEVFDAKEAVKKMGNS